MIRKLTIVVLFSTLPAFAVIYSVEKAPHTFSPAECPSCHATDPSGRIMKKRMVSTVTVLCKKCHRDIFSGGYMHPVDIKPKGVSLPLDMPLSQNGEMTCATCHDVHASPLTPLGTPSRYLRRIEQGKAFCALCHRESPSGPTHKGTLGEAHFRSRHIITDPSQEIDPLSKNCIRR